MNGSADLKPNDTDLARAEELIDRAGATLGGWLERFNREVLRTTARAREELEDIWAEARERAKS